MLQQRWLKEQKIQIIAVETGETLKLGIIANQLILHLMQIYLIFQQSRRTHVKLFLYSNCEQQF